ncbi:hypothetical protein JYU34_014186 [Plutella xylostella]|uniref:HAUS augmin-like complex subunit 3 N-terminal domain-containing protein n=1 Tax=Plutella xylostella TaxID=51655 RepID=A0ABQ7Q7Q4_PLUXY|nr:hypothetical protein JYU34_014186 [Plutella xylostella]
MNMFSETSDEEFIPFLNSLGVETYKKSFEWMLNDPDYAGVLGWLYKNLDQSNALTAREEYRYAEIQKKGTLQSPQELEESIASIMQQYEGVPLPGDAEAMEDILLETEMLEERLRSLERQEEIVTELVQQNEKTKEQLTCEVTKLNAMKTQCKQDEAGMSEECLSLAQEIEDITEGAIDAVADALTLYANSQTDEDTAKRFFALGPFDQYRQSQALFRSHFDLYCAKRFTSRQDEQSAVDNELRTALVDAKDLEERLAHAMTSYIAAQAELSGEQATLAVTCNYEAVHPSQYALVAMEAKTTVELLEQEECILEQQLQAAVRQFVERRSRHTATVAVSCALAVREQILSDLTALQRVTSPAHTLDACVYVLTRLSHRAARDAAQWSAVLREKVTGRAAASRDRLETMHAICEEQEICSQRLQSQDKLLHVISSILGLKPTTDVAVLVKRYAELLGEIEELKTAVDDRFRQKEERLAEM